MEILKGFVWDIQRHNSQNITGLKVYGDSVATQVTYDDTDATTSYVHVNTTNGAVSISTVETVDDTTNIASITNAGVITWLTDGLTATSSVATITLADGASGVKIPSGYDIGVGGNVTNKFKVDTDTTASYADSGTLLTIGSTAPTVTVSAGDIVLGSANPAVVTTADTSVKYTVALTSATSVKTTDSASLTLTAATAGEIKVTAAGAVTGLTDGAIVSNLVSGSVGTAANTTGNQVTVNDQLYELGADATVTFTVVSSVATLKTGTVALDASGNDKVKVANGTVTVTTGNVKVDKDGKVTGLNTGDVFKIDDVTYTVTDDPTSSDNYLVTVSGSTSQDGSYQVTKTAADADTAYITVAAGKNDTFEGFAPMGTVTYQHVDTNGTLALSTISGTTGTTVLHSGSTGKASDTEAGTIYGTFSKAGDPATYTLALKSTMDSFTSFTINTSSLGSNALKIDPTNMPASTVITNGSWSISNVAVTGDTINITGSVINAPTSVDSFTLTSGTITLGAKASGVTVTTNRAKLTVTDNSMGGSDTVRISSEGAVTGIATTDSTVTYNKNADAADDADPVEFMVNTKTFAAVANVTTTINYDDGVYELKTGSLRVSAGGSQVIDNNDAGTAVATVKVAGGDGIILNSDGSFSDLEDGETVTVTEADGDIVVYKVSGTTLSITATKNGGTTDSKTYTMEDSAVAISATPQTIAGVATVGTPTTATATAISVSAFGLSADSDTDLTNSTLGITDGVYITKNGVLTTDSSKAAGQFTVSDNTLSYTESATTGQQIYLGAPSTDYDKWSVTTSGGKDTIEAASTVETTINSGSGDDRIAISGRGTASVSAGDGKDRITIGAVAGDHSIDAGAGNDTITSSGTGSQILYGGEGDNKIRHTVATGDSTLWGGSGKDTISSANADDVIIGGDGADTFDIVTGNAKVTISDYTYGTDVLQVAATDATSVLSSSVTPALFTTDGIVSLSGTASADISASKSGGVYAATLVDGNGKNKLNVGWTDENGGNVDVTSTTDAVVLIGSLNDDAADALYSGSGKDTLYGGSNDSFYGGANADLISLKASTSGAVIGVATTSGKDTVKGFTTGFEDADSIFLVDGSASNVGATLSGSTLTFKDGDGSLELQSISTNSTLGGAELLVSGAKVAVAAKGGTLKTDNINYANYYIGNGSAADFSSVEGAMTVNLANGLDSSAEGPKFKGITTVKGGSASTVLMGATAAESIVAGTGTTSLWGGAGKDTLVGGSGVDTFFIGSGDGADVVTGFVGGTDDTSDSVTTLANITGAKLTSSGVEIAVGDSDKLTLQNVTADTAIKVNANGTELVAKVGSATGANNFTYDSKVSYYGGGNASDKIAFSSNYTDNAEIWLDGSHGKTYASVDVVDGTNTSGNLIAAGDSSSQSIIGGKGNSSLWGGAGSASDTLRSSSNGTTMFWWGMGEGNDVAVSASANDSVNLYNVKLSDVDLNNTAITSSGVTLALNDGSKLTVQTSRDMTFTVDGTSWTANHSSKTWQQNS